VSVSAEVGSALRAFCAPCLLLWKWKPLTSGRSEHDWQSATGLSFTTLPTLNSHRTANFHSLRWARRPQVQLALNSRERSIPIIGKVTHSAMPPSYRYE